MFNAASRRFQAGAGLTALVAGLGMVTAAAWLPSFWLVVAGGIVAGAGAGAAFRGTVATVISITPPQARGEGLAGLFLVAYVGLAIPVVGLGVATLWVSPQVAVLGFAIALAAAVLAVARRLLSLTRPRPRPRALLARGEGRARPHLLIGYDHFFNSLSLMTTFAPDLSRMPQRNR